MAEAPGHYAIFGDGTPIRIKTSVPEINNKTGKVDRRIGFRMTAEYEKKWNITDKDKEPETGFIYKSFPEDYFELLDPNPNTPRWLIVCGFDLTTTTLMTRIGDDLYVTLNSLRKEVSTLKLKNAVLHLELRKLSEDSRGYIEEYAATAKKLSQSDEEGERGG